MTRIISILLFCAAAQAGCGTVTLPPAPYDAGPLPTFTDYRVPYWQVNSVCRGSSHWADDIRGRFYGCNIHFPSGLNIRIVPSDQDPEFTACIIAHENGHLRGWPADHPGGRY